MGVYSVFHANLNGIPIENVKKYERIASLVLKRPKFVKNDEEYFKYIGPQLVELLHHKNRTLDHVQRATILCIGQFITQFPQLAREHVLNEIAKPLKQCMDFQQRKHEALVKLREKLTTQQQEQQTQTKPSSSLTTKPKIEILNASDDNDSDPIVTVEQDEEAGNSSNSSTQEDDNSDSKPEVILVDETRLVQCVEELHAILTGLPPSQEFLLFIGDHLQALFQLYCFVSRTRLNLKSACEEIMTTFFKLSDDPLQSAVKKLLTYKNRNSSSKQGNSNQIYVTFVPGESGGVSIRAELESKRDYMHEANCLFSLLLLMKNNNLAGDLFVYLITQFQLIREHMANELLIAQKQLLKQSLATSEEAEEMLKEQLLDDDTHVLMQLIKLMIDKLGASIIKNASQALAFVKFLLLLNEPKLLVVNPSSFNKEGEDDIPIIVAGSGPSLSAAAAAEYEDACDNVVTALGILTSILAGGISLEEEMRSHKLAEFDAKVQNLIPILLRLKQTTSGNGNLQEISEMTSTLLLVMETRQYMEQFDEDKKNSKADDELTILKAKFSTILVDLRDPLLPIRAHGVTELRKLVLERSPAMKQYMRQVLNIFETQLQDEDSYMYMAAILGLEAMADVYPDDIIPLLTKAFMNTKNELTLENVLKMGEALVKIAERCGAMLPKYASQFTHAFLTVCQLNFAYKFQNSENKEDEEQNAFFKAEALNNLASLCETLRFGVAPYMQDILDCTLQLLQQQQPMSHVQIRRACIQVLARLARGMDTELFDLLPGQTNKIVHAVRTAEFYDPDALVKHNAHMVNEQIEASLQRRLTPDHYLEWLSANKTAK